MSDEQQPAGPGGESTAGPDFLPPTQPQRPAPQYRPVGPAPAGDAAANRRGATQAPAEGPPQRPIGSMLVALGVIAAVVVLLIYWPRAEPVENQPTPTPTTQAPEPPEPEPEPEPEPVPERSGPSANMNPVTPAETLPAEQAELLGAVIDVWATPLRYNEGELFDQMFYRCIFNVYYENLTDMTLEVGFAYTVPGLAVVWDSEQPTTIEPGDSKRLALGWENSDPAELSVPRSQCQGHVELSVLEVTQR